MSAEPPDGAEQSDGLTPRWYAEQPTHSCQDCGRENLHRCYVCGLYDGERQRVRRLCLKCKAKRNRRLEQNDTSTTDADRRKGE